MSKDNTQTNGASEKSLAPIDGTLKATNVALLGQFIAQKMPALKGVAASHLNPKRLYRLVVSSVSKTPALQKCTMESIFRSTLQSAELGLEPGSATGEGYLVPFGDQCTFIPGYRGLIALAFRSGHVKSVSAAVVYQGDAFEFELGLEPKLKHVPNSTAKRDPKEITFGYCIVQLKAGGVVYDVMTRGEIDAIRGRSKAGSSGPWVTDFAEMAKKTVTRRCLKYAPMSVEMSKALALDEAIDTGDKDYIDAEFDSFEGLAELPQASESTKTDEIREKIGSPPADQVEGEKPQEALVS